MTLRQETLRIVANKKIAAGHYILEIASPRIAASARPGQFVQILTGTDCEPLLPRPFSFLDTSKKSFRILYQVVGRGTRLLSLMKPGDSVRVLGPLGCGFSEKFKTRSGARPLAILIGGGVGIPPLFHLAKTWVTGRRSGMKPEDIRVFLGGRTKELLHCERDFKKLGIKAEVATNDGSRGKKGFVTQLVDEFLCNAGDSGRSSRIFTCGPTPMLKAVSQLAAKYETPCEVSVEEPMPCGFGACLGCAIKVKAPGEPGFRYAITCCEGPVFSSGEILWE